MTIALFTDEPGAWHTRELKRAFLAREHDCRTVDLRQCCIDLSLRPHGLFLPGFAGGLPEAAFVRGVPGGTLEQVVLRLDILHALRELGVPVYNDARAIEKSVDKAMTSFLLNRAAVPTPPTLAAEAPAAVRRHLVRELAAGRPLVAKPLFGSQGKGLERIEAMPEAPPLQAGVAYLQHWLPPRGRLFCDWRIFVVGGRAVAGMRRESRHWVTNVAQGGRPRPVDLGDAEQADLARWAVAAAAALGMDYAGVDLMRDASGNPFVIEVNGAPAWKGLQRVTELDIAGALAADLSTRRLVPPRMAAHG